MLQAEWFLVTSKRIIWQIVQRRMMIYGQCLVSMSSSHTDVFGCSAD